MVENVIVFGMTDLAEVLADHLEQDGRYKIAAVTGDKKYLSKANSGGVLSRYPLVLFEEIDSIYPKDTYSFFICVGYTRMNEGRKQAYLRIKEKGYQVLTYIHPTALVQTDQIGEGCLIFENVTIGSFCSVGLCNIFYPCSYVGHHTHVGDFNFFAISCSVAGHVAVNDQCFFGNNSATKNGIVIASKTLIGAGAYLAGNTNECDVIVPNRSYKLDNILSTEIEL